MTKIYFLIPIMSLAIGGCAQLSVQELRDRPSTQTLNVQGNYLSIGSCVAEKMQTGPTDTWSGDVGDLKYDTLHRPDVHRFTVTGKFHLESISFPAIDIVFSSIYNEKTKVDIRNGGGNSLAISNLSKYVDRASHYVDKCSQEVALLNGRQINTPAPATLQELNQSQVITVNKNNATESGSATKLRELNYLKEQGLITDSEFRKKREAILSNF